MTSLSQSNPLTSIFFHHFFVEIPILTPRSEDSSRLEDFRGLPLLRDRFPFVGERKIEEDRANRGPTTAGKNISDEKNRRKFSRSGRNLGVSPRNTSSRVFRPELLREDASSSQSNVSNPHSSHFTHPSQPTKKSRFLPAHLTVINLSKPLRDKVVPRLYLEVPDAPIIEASEAPFLLEKRSKTPPRKGLFSHRNLII